MSAAKGEYKHFMQKEIFEQANSLTDTIRGRVDLARGEVYLEQVTLTEEKARDITQLVTVACGTSYHSELVGAFMFEQLARLPVRVEYASEFRYRDPVLDSRTLMLAITQSGETVDTLAAMEEGKSHGAHLASIVNVIGSQAARVSDSVIYMHTGPEIGVASTKAFTASLVDQYLLAVHLGSLRGTLDVGAAAPPARRPGAAARPGGPRARPRQRRRVRAAGADLLPLHQLPLPRPGHQLPDRAWKAR